MPRAPSCLPTATVDVALHIGEVLYGNLDATDQPRLRSPVGRGRSMVVSDGRYCGRCAAPLYALLVSYLLAAGGMAWPMLANRKRPCTAACTERKPSG
jgi:hypothetical protein